MGYVYRLHGPIRTLLVGNLKNTTIIINNMPPSVLSRQRETSPNLVKDFTEIMQIKSTRVDGWVGGWVDGWMGWWGGYVWVCGWSVVNTLFLPTRRCCGVPCTGPAGVAAVVPLAKIRHANIISHKRRSSIKNDLAP